jgi:hypothetical protein
VEYALRSHGSGPIEGDDMSERDDKILATPDPEAIWLSPKCEALCDEGRTWCSEPQDCQDCDFKAVKYIRSDLASPAQGRQDPVTSREELLKEADEHLSFLVNLPGVHPHRIARIQEALRRPSQRASDHQEEVARIFREYLSMADERTTFLLQDVLHDVDDALSSVSSTDSRGDDK